MKLDLLQTLYFFVPAYLANMPPCSCTGTSPGSRGRSTAGARSGGVGYEFGMKESWI
jgi:hypothetical protein